MAEHAQTPKEPTVAGRSRQQNQPAPPPEDPLADLRAPDDAPGLALTNVPGPVAPSSTESPEEPEAVAEVRPMVTQDTQDAMVAEAVAAWHADPTSQGFLHGGGQCGCRYIARAALQAAVPVMTEEDQEPRELEPSHG